MIYTLIAAPILSWPQTSHSNATAEANIALSYIVDDTAPYSACHARYFFLFPLAEGRVHLRAFSAQKKIRHTKMPYITYSIWDLNSRYHRKLGVGGNVGALQACHSMFVAMHYDEHAILLRHKARAGLGDIFSSDGPCAQGLVRANLRQPHIDMKRTPLWICKAISDPQQASTGSTAFCSMRSMRRLRGRIAACARMGPIQK